jgi:hypothetical protein
MTQGRASITARVLGSTIAISTTSALVEQLSAQCAELLDDRSAAAGPAHRLTLHGNGAADPVLGGDPIQNALAEITRFAVAHSPLLCIHAGVVAGPNGLIAIPGASGHGKTTLVAALLQAGFGYVSDEVLALDRTTLRVTPFRRPLAMDARSLRLLGLDESVPPPAPHDETVVPLRLLGACAGSGVVGDIVMSRRAAGPVTMTPSRRGAAVTAVLSRAFNHYTNSRSSFHTVIALARQARVWDAAYADARELAGVLARS